MTNKQYIRDGGEQLKKPLVSMYVISYNQEAFVGQAMKAALAQDYPNLQIIFSDDNSNDGTWRIMQETASGYNGPHQVVLNRNGHNLGICGHINKVVGMCDSEYIIATAADDVSLPHRVSVIMETFEREPEAMLVWSAYRLIDGRGMDVEKKHQPQRLDPTPENIACGKYRVIGCSMAFRKAVYDQFGIIDSRCVLEDMIISLRAVLLGKVVKILEPLLLYRVSSDSITNHDRTSGPERVGKIRKVAGYDVLSRSACLTDVYYWESVRPENSIKAEKIRKLLRRAQNRHYIKYLALSLPRAKALIIYVKYFLFSGSFFRLLKVCRRKKELENNK